MNGLQIYFKSYEYFVLHFFILLVKLEFVTVILIQYMVNFTMLNVFNLNKYCTLYIYYLHILLYFFNSKNLFRLTHYLLKKKKINKSMQQ